MKTLLKAVVLSFLLCAGRSSSSDDSTCSLETDGPCADAHRSCRRWASRGQGESDARYMLSACRKSCGVCGVDIDDVDIGVEQTIDAAHEKECLERIASAKQYVHNVIAKDPRQRKLLEGCQLQHQDCAYWAVLGECEANPGYMKLKCAPVCETCDQLTIESRCPIDPETMPNAWEPGDLNRFFTNITTLDEYKRYEPHVLSRPDYLPGDTEETADYKIGPWVVTMERVVTQEEAERLVELGGIRGYERSADVGELKFDGTFDDDVNDGRTSTNAWCEDECYNDTVAQRVIHRLANISNIPEENSEFLQLLRYEVGQKYETHHDYIDFEVNRQQGVRMITILLYLNDLEEGAGGETQFPDLGITVEPKLGRALVWPSVRDEDPDRMDERTMHQALPVTRSVKYAANAWIHRRDIKTPMENGCN